MKEKRLYYGTGIVNIAIAVFMMFIFYKNAATDFTIRDSYVDNYLHRTLFSHLAEQVTATSVSFAMVCLAVAVILTIISFIFRNCRNYLVAYRLLYAGVVADIATFIVFLLTNIIVGNCRIESGLWYILIGIILFVLGALAIYLGTPDLFKERKKRWDVLIATGVLAVCGGVIVIPSMMTVKEDFKYAKELRSVISSQPDSIVEEVGVQIGNYYNALSVYAEDKIYYMESVKDFNIRTVDKDGNSEVFWTTKSGEINWGLFYREGYLYISVSERNEAKCRLLRISVDSGAEEVIYESDSYFMFGGAGDKIFYTTPKDENGLCDVRYFDLTEENIGESSVLYDKDVDYYNLNNNIFVARYLYNDSSDALRPVSWLIAYDGIIIYDGNAYLMAGRNGWKESTELEMLNYHNAQYEETLIDEDVMCRTIYDDKLYYVKVKDDTAYDVICCDLQGENKTVIGTISKEKETYCRYLSVGEDFILLQMKGDNEKEFANHAFFMKSEDGSSVQLY